MQANVRRGANAHSIALKLVQENEIDILLVQAPWILRNIYARRLIPHPNFLCFSPLSEWHSRPRVLIYVRKSHGLHP
ncbi:unnamed protein product [Blumeria hordei]|uniref:BRCT domain-containing protein n=1 Tax=Blumeria hordei TaxID=2867405 RepID=A0A383UJD4_BLUHO|nr:unnamed protein product [Blumeria hordei]